jgi:cation transport regulator ChaC
MHAWIFGYGSLIWHPDIPYEDRRPARLSGWQRRFWQGSHDHRGVPDSPGRVVTLVPTAGAHCDGVAYRVTPEVVREVFETLDHREKNGYERHKVELEFRDRPERATGLVYIAPADNHAYLGPAPLPAMARQISVSVGPSGRNLDYLLALARALRDLEADDPHVFELERAVLEEQR